mgnify:CR=1 FL=1|tara:strand:- start:489 stop:1238 length:750 start_codon:yes stop_codon:yes gene_type:complete
MDSNLLERYSRNIILREIGGMGQKRLSRSKILIIGAGGLGNSSATYLAASGVGKIGLVDPDVVSLSNLQRQVLFKERDIGKLKVESAKVQLNALNPHTKIETYPYKISENNIEKIFIEYDLILDGSDNFSTRYLINKFCFIQKKPLLFGAISQWDGQISLYDPIDGSACFECLYPEAKTFNVEENCSNTGVLGPLVGVIGSLMSVEAIKFVVSAGSSLKNELIIYEGLSGLMRRYKTCSRVECKVCGKI